MLEAPPGALEHLKDAAQYLLHQSMPALVLITVLSFPLVVGVGGFLTAGGSPLLLAAIAALPGRKFVYTNGSRGHADRVTEYMGIADVFDGRFAIEDSAFLPKPNQSSYDAFLAKFDVDPKGAVFFEDLARNLAPASAMGFATVLVQSDKDWSHEPASARPAGIGDDLPPHIDYVTRDLTQFLRSIPQ